MAKKKSSISKKLAIIFGSLFGILVLAAIILPLVVDVDKYRPLIISKANERLNGKLELGKLGLSLWGRVQIDIDGLKLTDAAGRTIVDVKDAGFNMPLLSLLSGSPRLRLEMQKPVINVVKQKSGKLNVMTLMKTEPAASGTGAGTGTSTSTSTSSKPGASQGTEVPAIVMNSRVTILLSDATFSYKDEITADSYKVDDLNFRLEDVSPSSTMPFEITANLDLLAQKKIKVTGPVVFKGSAKATSSNGEFDRAELGAMLDLSGAEILYPGLLNKSKGVALGADVKGVVSKDSFNIPTLKFSIADVTIDGQTSGKTVDNVTTIDFKAHSNRIDVAKLSGLTPLVKEYGLNGIVELSANAQGPTSNLGYGADVKFNKVQLSHESMKQPIEVNGALEVATNQLKSMVVKMAAKDFDLNINGSMQNFAAPRFKFNVVSNNMDLDGLLKASAKAADDRQTQAKAEAGATGEGQPKAANVVDYNAMFKPLRENPVTAAAAGTIDFGFKRVKTTGVAINDLKGQLALNNLVMQLKDFSMRIFDGSIKGGMSFNARSAKPEVASNITLAGLDTKKMAENAMPLARDSIKGVISAALNVGGPGLNQSDIVANWRGSGTMDIKDAEFKTLDIGRHIRDGALTKLPEPLRGKIKVPDKLIDREGRYQVMNMKFGLDNGVLNVSDITGKAYPNEGLDLKGGGTIGMGNYALNLTLDIIDTYNLLNADQYAPDKRYGHFALSPKVGGSLFNPKFDWGATIGKLAENAAKAQAKQAIQKELGNKLPGGFGKIFGGGNKDSENSGDKNKQEQKPADAVRGALKGIFGK